jgi:myo-inositol 2-dehydrogenase/D-chiro-inositol 1-dehydrogenase
MKISRRTFVAMSGTLAAGTSTRVLAATNKNSRPTVALVGCGGKGTDLSKVVAPFADMVACCDVDRRQADKFSAGKVPIFEDYRELLARGDIDVILNATPDHWHTAINIAALKAGVHVYGEKPMTLTVDEGKLLCKVVRDTGNVMQVGAQQRSSPWFRRAVAIARSGLLGGQITATCHLGKGRAGGPFKPKVPYVPQRCHKSFRFWFEYSGGEVTDWGAHHVDIAQWGIGAENTGPIEVETGGYRDTREHCYNTAQTFDSILRFSNGNVIRIMNSRENGVMFEGRRGSVFVNRDGISGDIPAKMTTADTARIDRLVDTLYDGRLGIPDQDIPTPKETDKAIWEKVKTSHMGNFFNCISDGNAPVSNVYSVHRTISSCHLCNIALLAGRKLRWDPENEKVENDAQANAALSRKQRKPYTIEA